MHATNAVGYILYGPSTMLVYSIGKEFTLHARPQLRRVLSEENIQIPNHGSIYSVNEGNFWQWDESIRNTSHVHRTEGYTARYSGASRTSIEFVQVECF